MAVDESVGVPTVAVQFLAMFHLLELLRATLVSAPVSIAPLFARSVRDSRWGEVERGPARGDRLRRSHQRRRHQRY